MFTLTRLSSKHLPPTVLLLNTRPLLPLGCNYNENPRHNEPHGTTGFDPPATPDTRLRYNCSNTPRLRKGWSDVEISLAEQTSLTYALRTVCTSRATSFKTRPSAFVSRIVRSLVGMNIPTWPNEQVCLISSQHGAHHSSPHFLSRGTSRQITTRRSSKRFVDLTESAAAFTPETCSQGETPRHSHVLGPSAPRSTLQHHFLQSIRMTQAGLWDASRCPRQARATPFRTSLEDYKAPKISGNKLITARCKVHSCFDRARREHATGKQKNKKNNT